MAARAAPFRIAGFQADVTPPIGHPLAYGINRQVDAPLYVRGLVVDDGHGRAVLASVNFLGIAGRAYADWKRRIARAAGTSPGRVLLHCIHQHDSLLVKLEADELLAEHGYAPKVWPDYWAKATAALQVAVEEAVRPGRWQAVRHLATAERRLAGLASNRRLLGPDRRVRAMRFSMCTYAQLKAEPVGLIDPILRTIGFLGTGERILATIHFYATHPQVAYFRNMAGSDMPGVALGCLREALDGRGTHLYFTGCGANLACGKYTFTNKEESLRVLGCRLGAGLVANAAALEPQPSLRLALTSARFELPLARKFTAARLLMAIEQAETHEDGFMHAVRLTLLANWQANRRPAITRLSLGPGVHILSLPLEVVVDYQLFAQSLVPEQFLACAACGDYGFGYLPTAAMYAQGGYEPNAGMWTPALEASLKKAIGNVLQPLR